MYTHKGRNTHAHSHSLAQTCAEHPQMRIHENDKFISKSAICFAAIATSAPKTARLLNKIGFWLDAHLRRCCASLGRTMWVCVRVFVFVCLCVRVVPTQCLSGRTLCQYLSRLHQELQNHSFMNWCRCSALRAGMLTNYARHQWSSGRIHRCHRCDPGSIPG